jgi:hypothetical protein
MQQRHGTVGGIRACSDPCRAVCGAAVDGRVKSGHDDEEMVGPERIRLGEAPVAARRGTKARRSVSRVLSRHQVSLETGMAIHLGRPSPDASRDRPERRRESTPGTVARACHSYLVLLPVGFALPSPLLARRCALTAPFHPYRPCRPIWGGDGLGGMFSVALSLGSPPPAINRHRASEEPGLSSLRLTAKSGHPTVWQWDDMGQSGQTVKTTVD